MADTVIADALPGIQDEGLPNISDNREDWGSAGLRMVLAQAVDSGSYARSDSELTFTAHDATNDTVDVTAGIAYLSLTGETVDVQSAFGGSSPPSYDTTLPTLPAIPVIVPTGVADVPLQDATLSSVWLAYATDGTVTGVAAGDVYVRSDDSGTVSAPPHPHVELGQANPDNAGADDLRNRYPSATFNSINTDDQTINNSVTYPDGTTITTSPSGETNYVVEWGNANLYGPVPSEDIGSWSRDSNNPVVEADDSWNSSYVADPHIIKVGDTYHMYYSGNDGSVLTIGHATSTDLTNWSDDSNNPVITTGSSGSWDESEARKPSVVYIDGTFHLVYWGSDSNSTDAFGYATSTDGSSFTKSSSNPIFTSGSGFDSNRIVDPKITRRGGIWYLFYGGNSGGDNKIGVASGPDLTSLSRYSNNPIISPVESWEGTSTIGPDVRQVGDSWCMMYRGGGSEFGYAYAEAGDNSSWQKGPNNPVFSPSGSGWDSSELDHPTWMFADGNFEMMYLGNDGSQYAIGHATISLGTP